MNIIVLLKQTFDTEAKIQLDSNNNVITDNIQYIINPYDEFALEEAIRIKEKLGDVIITVVSMGPRKVEEALRQALAMGADKSILLNDEVLFGGDEHTAAVALSQTIKQIPYDLIIGGQVAIDDGSGQVAIRVAEILDIPQVNLVTKLDVENNKLAAHRQVEVGTEVIEVFLPAMITAQKGLNEPRYPALKGIMQAKKKELRILGLADLGLTENQVGSNGANLKVISTFLPAPRNAGRILSGEISENVQELVRLLREEAKII